MKLLVSLLILFSLFTETIQAQPENRQHSFNLSSRHVAIGGYDAVAYFKQRQPVKGIVNGKLFLFYNKYLNNTLKSWNKDEKALNARDGHLSNF
jgi:hypothetical protein